MGSGGRNLNSPTGGNANGIPKYLSTGCGIGAFAEGFASTCNPLIKPFRIRTVCALARGQIDTIKSDKHNDLIIIFTTLRKGEKKFQV